MEEKKIIFFSELLLNNWLKGAEKFEGKAE